MSLFEVKIAKIKKSDFFREFDRGHTLKCKQRGHSTSFQKSEKSGCRPPGHWRGVRMLLISDVFGFSTQLFSGLPAGLGALMMDLDSQMLPILIKLSVILIPIIILIMDLLIMPFMIVMLLM